jgi:hypothetical protein
MPWPEVGWGENLEQPFQGNETSETERNLHCNLPFCTVSQPGQAQPSQRLHGMYRLVVAFFRA